MKNFSAWTASVAAQWAFRTMSMAEFLILLFLFIVSFLLMKKKNFFAWTASLAAHSAFRTMSTAELPEELPTAELPEELVVNILSRLSVKPLLRFRCVSKSWRSLIDSSSFLKLHLSKNRNSKIYLFRVKEVKLSFAKVDLLNFAHRLHSQSIILPVFSPSDGNVNVVGLCDGLICLLSSRKLVLVNPSTRTYKLLPPTTEVGRFDAIGVGYDCSADEYKVIAIPEDGSEVNIYGSKSNTWRQMDISCKNKGREFERYGKYTHGALHWIVGPMYQIFHIMAFDLANEEFTEAEYDQELFGNPVYVFLLVVGGRLCLYCRHDVEEGKEGYLDIWVMEEYGVRESWSKLVSFDRDVEPLAFSNCGRRLLFGVFRSWPCSCRLHWYDVDKKSLEYVDKKSLEHIDTWMATYYHFCLQSLIRLEGKLL